MLLTARNRAIIAAASVAVAIGGAACLLPNLQRKEGFMAVISHVDECEFHVSQAECYSRAIQFFKTNCTNQWTQCDWWLESLVRSSLPDILDEGDIEIMVRNILAKCESSIGDLSSILAGLTKNLANRTLVNVEKPGTKWAGACRFDFEGVRPGCLNKAPLQWPRQVASIAGALSAALLVGVAFSPPRRAESLADDVRDVVRHGAASRAAKVELLQYIKSAAQYRRLQVVTSCTKAVLAIWVIWPPVAFCVLTCTWLLPAVHITGWEILSEPAAFLTIWTRPALYMDMTRSKRVAFMMMSYGPWVAGIVCLVLGLLNYNAIKQVQFVMQWCSFDAAFVLIFMVSYAVYAISVQAACSLRLLRPFSESSRWRSALRVWDHPVTFLALCLLPALAILQQAFRRPQGAMIAFGCAMLMSLGWALFALALPFLATDPPYPGRYFDNADEDRSESLAPFSSPDRAWRSATFGTRKLLLFSVYLLLLSVVFSWLMWAFNVGGSPLEGFLFVLGLVFIWSVTAISLLLHRAIVHGVHLAAQILADQLAISEGKVEEAAVFACKIAEAAGTLLQSARMRSGKEESDWLLLPVDSAVAKEAKVAFPDRAEVEFGTTVRLPPWGLLKPLLNIMLSTSSYLNLSRSLMAQQHFIFAGLIAAVILSSTFSLLSRGLLRDAPAALRESMTAGVPTAAMLELLDSDRGFAPVPAFLLTMYAAPWAGISTGWGALSILLPAIFSVKGIASYVSERVDLEVDVIVQRMKDREAEEHGKELSQNREV
mmetsp:Transcript_23636/g.67807  ORF Transcript_23636/g.67807 Transcript_23636/m.67807 type:complete len:770 (+) Transcript_23636:41-2350(+)